MNRKKLYPKIKNTILRLKGKKDPHINSKQGLLILENGLEGLEMGMEYRSGLTEPDMKDNGKIIGLTVMARLFILTEMSMKEIGSMIRLMALEYIFM